MSKRKTTIGILTGGGDCPGINAVIRAVAKTAMMKHGWRVIGIEDGYEGLIRGRFRPLGPADVSGLLTLGGTILGTSNTADPYRYAEVRSGRVVLRDVSRRLLRNARAVGLDALILIGGDGTLASAAKLQHDGLPVIGVPKTIDNDLGGTDVTFGFDTAVGIATEAVDRLHTTAQSHHRVMIVEVMGRRAGWIALYAGVAGGGDVILIPEIPYRIEAVARKVRERRRQGKHFSLIVTAEGAMPLGGAARHPQARGPQRRSRPPGRRRVRAGRGAGESGRRGNPGRRPGPRPARRHPVGGRPRSGHAVGRGSRPSGGGGLVRPHGRRPGRRSDLGPFGRAGAGAAAGAGRSPADRGGQGHRNGVRRRRLTGLSSARSRRGGRL